MKDIIAYTETASEEMYANELVKAEKTDFYGWLCHVGLEGIDIKQDGTIIRGTCRVGGVIGHVDDEVWNLPTEPIVCDKRACNCVADLKNTRYKDEDSKPNI
jgi:hypothetical protein